MDILNKRMSKITLTTLEVSSFGWHRIKGVPRWIFYDVFGRRDEKISAQPHTSLCIHNLLVIRWIIKPHIWMHNEVWGCAEIFPKRKVTCGGRSHPTVDTLHWWAHLKRWSALMHSGIIWLGLQRDTYFSRLCEGSLSCGAVWKQIQRMVGQTLQSRSENELTVYGLPTSLASRRMPRHH